MWNIQRWKKQKTPNKPILTQPIWDHEIKKIELYFFLLDMRYVIPKKFNRLAIGWARKKGFRNGSS